MQTTRNRHIATVALAVFAALLTIQCMPHHHHEGMLCAVVERCAKDGNSNDGHTGHGDDGTSCVEEDKFLPAISDTRQTCNAVYKHAAYNTGGVAGMACIIAGTEAVDARASAYAAILNLPRRPGCRHGLRAPPFTPYPKS